jgi:CheY-like chemotaxis protein
MVILVADDDPTTRTLVATILRRAGHKPILAQDALQVMAMAKQHNPDVIVLDVQMPAGTGAAALQNLKGSALTSHVPVIVLSGVANQQKIQELLDMGATDFLPKPVNEELLLGALYRASPEH